MIWMSVDAALNRSGVALWRGPDLLEAFTLRPMGVSGQWARWKEGKKLYSEPSRRDAWASACRAPTALVLAVERGAHRNADRALGRATGYLEAVADWRRMAYADVELMTWRRAIAEVMEARGTPITWPAGESKTVAIAAARALYPALGAAVTDDEAEAVLIGRAAMRLRLVDVGEVAR